VLFSTHITSDLEKCADNIVFINRGEIVFTGSKDELISKYIRVSGGKNDISKEQKSEIIGYREHSYGFEGLIEQKNSSEFSDKILKEKATLEEIVIYFDRAYGEEKA
jgi:ABC-2 type transport system ATP-binding protein